MYLAGLGPVNEGTPMNLYCIRGGGGGRTVERRGSFLTLGGGGLRGAAFAVLALVAAGGRRAARPDGRVALPALVAGTLGSGDLAGVIGLAAGRSIFSGPLLATLTGFLAMAEPDFGGALPDFLKRGSLREGFFFSARLCRAGMVRINSL